MTVGIGPIQSAGQPKFVRSVLAQSHHGIGFAGMWSGNGSVIVINDPHDTAKLRETKVTIHDETGSPLGVLNTGMARNSAVVAISTDGRFVVTLADLDHRPMAREKGLHRRIQLWSRQ